MYFQKSILVIFFASLFYFTFANGQKNYLSSDYLYFSLIKKKQPVSVFEHFVKAGYSYGSNELISTRSYLFANQEFKALEDLGIFGLRENLNNLDAYLDVLVAYSAMGLSDKVHWILNLIESNFLTQNISVNQQLDLMGELIGRVFRALQANQLQLLYDDFVRKISTWQSSILSVVYFLRISHELERFDLLDWSFKKVLNSPYAILAAVDYFDLFFYRKKSVSDAFLFLKENLYQFNPVNSKLFLIYLDVLKVSYQRLGKTLTPDELSFLVDLVLPMSQHEPKLLFYLSELYDDLGEEKLLLKTLNLLLQYDDYSDLAYESIANIFEKRGDYQGALAYYRQITKEPYLFKARKKILLFSDKDSLRLSDQIDALKSLYPNEKKDQFIFLETQGWYALYQNYLALDELNRLSKPFKQQAEILFLKGQIYFDLKETQKACDFMQQAVDKVQKPSTVKESFTSLNYQSALGNCLLSLQASVAPKARTLIVSAYQSKPIHADYLANFAWLRFIENNYTEAIDLLEKASQYAYNERQQVKVAKRLATALFFVGRKKRGYLVLKKAYENYPNNPNILSTMKQLRVNF